MFKKDKGAKIVKRLIPVLPIGLLLLATGCSTQEQESVVGHVENVMQNPSQMPATFVSIMLILMIFFWWTRSGKVIYDILDSVIVTSLVMMTLSPFFYLTTEQLDVTYVMLSSGAIGTIGGLICRLVVAHNYRSKPGRRTESQREADPAESA